MLRVQTDSQVDLAQSPMTNKKADVPEGDASLMKSFVGHIHASFVIEVPSFEMATVSWLMIIV